MINKLAGIAVLCILVGCTAIPEQIKLSQDQNLLKFNQVTDSSVGETVRWGGVITALSKQDGAANVTITQYPLLHSGQPTYSTGSEGRFTVKFNEPLKIDGLQSGTVLTLIGKVEDIQNPHPDLRTTQLVVVQADAFYIWDGFSRADHPPTFQNYDPAFIQRGKWGWQVKSEKDMQRERQERLNGRNARRY
jgi:starvation-inducible outer membrane lipoprotein